MSRDRDALCGSGTLLLAATSATAKNTAAATKVAASTDATPNSSDDINRVNPAAITAPTAIPAVMPFSLAPVETFRIVSMSRNVRTNSRTKDWRSEPAGWVAPRNLFCGNSTRSKPLAMSAPVA